MGDFAKLGGALGAGIAGLFIVKEMTKEVRQLTKAKKSHKKSYNKKMFLRKR